MTDEHEREVAHWVAQLVQRECDVVPGPPTERDGSDGSVLTVDFTYDEANPPFAVEVTRLRDDFERPPVAELSGLEERLRRHVIGKRSPHWTVGIRTEAKLRSDLEPAIRQMIEWMLAADVDTLGAGTYVHDLPADLLHRMGKRFMRDCDAARLAGVILITRRSKGGLRVFPVVEFSDSKSFQRPLTRAFARKASSMGKAKARGYVTMLAVDVEREDASGYLSEGFKAGGFQGAGVPVHHRPSLAVRPELGNGVPCHAQRQALARVRPAEVTGPGWPRPRFRASKRTPGSAPTPPASSVERQWRRRCPVRDRNVNATSNVVPVSSP